MRIFAACNRLALPCGCVSWFQLEAGVWVRQSWACFRHTEEDIR
jgi:hypothetical protein